MNTAAAVAQALAKAGIRKRLDYRAVKCSS